MKTSFQRDLLRGRGKENFIHLSCLPPSLLPAPPVLKVFKVHPLTRHESQEGVRGQRHAPAALPPGKRPGTHCIGG